MCILTADLGAKRSRRLWRYRTGADRFSCHSQVQPTSSMRREAVSHFERQLSFEKPESPLHALSKALLPHLYTMHITNNC